MRHESDTHVENPSQALSAAGPLAPRESFHLVQLGLENCQALTLEDLKCIFDKLVPLFPGKDRPNQEGVRLLVVSILESLGQQAQFVDVTNLLIDYAEGESTWGDVSWAREYQLKGRMRDKCRDAFREFERDGEAAYWEEKRKLVPLQRKVKT